jgi:hypothetical protein
MLQHNVSSATTPRINIPRISVLKMGNAARTEREGMLSRVHHRSLVAQENKVRKLSFATETALPNNQ